MNTRFAVIASASAWITEQALCFIFDRFARTAFEMVCLAH